jgi:hypothetical protein
MKRLLTVIGLGCALLLHPAGSAAQPAVHVDCSGSAPGAFPSINAALASIPLDSPHVVIVSGMCQEFVDVVGRRHLTIEGQPGAMIVATAQPPRPTLLIQGSSNIIVRGITVRADGIRVQDSTVEMDDVTSEQSARPGLIVSGQSFLWMRNGHLLDNAGDGLLAIEGAGVRLSQVESRGNGSGIAVNTADVWLLGGVTLEENRGSGLFVRAGRVRMDASTAPILIQSNGVGINATGGSSVHMIGDITVARNNGFGIQGALGTSIELQASGPATAVRRTTIEENGSVGINLAGSASANISGPHAIRNNGRDGGRAPGLRVGSTSRIQFNGQAEISGNSGPGVIAEWNAAIFLGGASVTNNAQESVRVLRNSVTMLGGMVAGNGGASVTCDTTGLVVLQTTAISGVRCARVERAHGPLPPGWIK